MEIMKHIEVKFEQGKVIIEGDLKAFIIPALDKLKEDVESGKIDPVKGTDLDKIAIEQVIELLKKQLA